jgi:hypothetical protein
MATPGRVEITADLRQRFERCAPAALRRRSPAYLGSVVSGSAQLPVLGAIGLAGLYFRDWSPLTLFAMLVAGLAANILVCTLRWLLARHALREQVERHNDDRFVWAMVEALRGGENHVQAGELLRYRAGAGILLDWLLGALALGLLAVGLWKLGMRSPAQLLSGGGLEWAVLAAITIPLLQGLFALWSWRNAEDAVLEGFGAGIHGATMLVFAAILAFGIDSMDALRKLMVGLNWAIIVTGGIALIGCRLMRQQADWLRKHLE